MEIEGNIAKLSGADLRALGIAPQDNKELVCRLPIDAARMRLQEQIEALNDEQDLADDDYFFKTFRNIFGGFVVARRLERVTGIAGQVLAHETEAFLSTYHTPRASHEE